MLDINGGELRTGGMAMLLCEVVDVDNDHVRVRVMNSELEIDVGVKRDEVLGGLVVDSELTAFDPTMDPGAVVAAGDDDQADGVKTWPME